MKAKFDKIYKEIVDTIAEKGIWSKGNVRTKYADEQLHIIKVI